MNTHVTGKRRLLSFINQLISWYTLTVQLSWSGCRIFPPATYGARCRLHPYSWVKKKTHQKSRLKQSILSSTIGRPAYYSDYSYSPVIKNVDGRLATTMTITMTIIMTIYLFILFSLLLSIEHIC